MAPPTKKTIERFTHPGHQLTEFKAETEYLCDGCKTPGSGKRYRCNKCDFDLHDYCGICPESLSTFMHPHKLGLVMQKARSNWQHNRICDVCHDIVEGLFYRCRDCDFDVHPMCTQLPETLSHVLHQAHSLKLESPSASNSCAVCGHECSSWRYRCGNCGFDIHLECVLIPCSKTKQRGNINPQYFPPPVYHHHPPPQPPYFGYAPPFHGCYHPYGFPYRPCPSYNMYHNNWAAQPQQVAGANPMGLGKRMFGLVGQLGLGVMSNFIFGTDITSFFS